jgi:hypothetical protein
MFPDFEFRGTLVLGLELFGRRHFHSSCGEGWLMKKPRPHSLPSVKKKNDGDAIVLLLKTRA